MLYIRGPVAVENFFILEKTRLSIKTTVTINFYTSQINTS